MPRNPQESLDDYFTRGAAYMRGEGALAERAEWEPEDSCWGPKLHGSLTIAAYLRGEGTPSEREIFLVREEAHRHTLHELHAAQTRRANLRENSAKGAAARRKYTDADKAEWRRVGVELDPAQLLTERELARRIALRAPGKHAAPMETIRKAIRPRASR